MRHFLKIDLSQGLGIQEAPFRALVEVPRSTVRNFGTLGLGAKRVRN